MAEKPKARIFEYAVIHQPATVIKEGVDVTPKATLIVEVTRVLAATDAEVAMQAARSIPTDFADKLEECEIAVRPF